MTEPWRVDQGWTAAYEVGSLKAEVLLLLAILLLCLEGVAGQLRGAGALLVALEAVAAAEVHNVLP